MAKLYGGDGKGPLRSAKPRRPAGMSGRQWKRLRKANGLSTKSAGFFRPNKEKPLNPADYAAHKIGELKAE
jgi:hypothetical protein